MDGKFAAHPVVTRLHVVPGGLFLLFAPLQYKGKATDPQKIGQELGVRAVLSGRLLQRDDMLIVRAELMDVANGSQLWGEQHNRKAADVLALQDDISVSHRILSAGSRERPGICACLCGFGLTPTT